MGTIDIPNLISLFEATSKRQKDEQAKFCSQWFNDLSQKEKNSFRLLHKETNRQLTILSKTLRNYLRDNPQGEYGSSIVTMLEEAFPEHPFVPSYAYAYVEFPIVDGDGQRIVRNKARMWQVCEKDEKPFWCLQTFTGNGFEERTYNDVRNFKLLKFFENEEDMVRYNGNDISA